MITSIPAGFENLQATRKEVVIQEMIDLLETAGMVKTEQKKNIVKAIMDREMMGTTGIMNGVGVPHAKCDGMEDLICCVGRSTQGIDYEALDDQPVFILFLLLTPKEKSSDHLVTLAQLSAVLRDDKIIKALKQAPTAVEMLQIMTEV